MAAVVLPYEDTGTATVTAGSADVVGQGTRWTQCRPGDTFYGRAGERNIVQAIADDTHLSLRFPATIAQAAQGVAVMRTPDDVFTQTMARQVFQKITDSPLLALAGLAAAPRKGIRYDPNSIPETFDFTDKAKTLLGTDLSDNVMSLLGAANYPAFRTLLNVAAKQSSISDATAGAGLLVGAFGLGGTSGMDIPNSNYNQALRTGIYYGAGSSAVNGPPQNGVYGPLLVLCRVASVVVQIAGYADTVGSAASLHVRYTGDSGATWTTWRPLLPEIASNPNGYYIRFGDGTQICWNAFTPSSQPINNAYGSSFISPAGTTRNFPASFVSGTVPAAVTGVWSAGGGRLVCNSYSVSHQQITYVFECAVSGTYTVGESYVAIGRWFN